MAHTALLGDANTGLMRGKRAVCEAEALGAESRDGEVVARAWARLDE